MVFISYNNEISPCLLCTTYDKKTCDCQHLDIYVYESLLYAKNSDATNNNDSLKSYQKEKQQLLPEIKKKFPEVKTIQFYPFDLNDLKNG